MKPCSRKQAHVPSMLASPVYLQFQLLLFFLSCCYFRTCISLHINQCAGRVGHHYSIGSGLAAAVNKSGVYAANHYDTTNLIKRPNHLSVYPIKYASSDLVDSAAATNTLFGWLHVRLDIGSEGSEPGISLYIMQGWVPNTKGEAYSSGEFVITDFSPGCKEYLTILAGHPKFEKKFLAPCFYSMDPGTSVPQAIALTFKTDREKTEPNYNLLDSSTFNYRTDFPECGGMHEDATFEFGVYASVYYRNVETRQQSVYQKEIRFSNKAYGGFDPAPPRKHAKLTCDNLLGSNNSKTEWIAQSDTPAPFPPLALRPVCSTELHTNPAKWETDRFRGRCNHPGNEPWHSSTNQEYTCKKRNPDSDKWPPYVPTITSGTCMRCEKARNITLKYGVAANSLIGRYIWSFRTTHGIAMASSTMFLAPVSTLFARYFKESHMGFRCVNLHVWHGAHISATMTLVGGLVSGMTAGVVARAYFGFSWHPIGTLHSALGWASILLFMFSLATGPLRLYPMFCRVVSIFSHFLLGSLTRILWTFCLLTCFYIPASPAGKFDIHKVFKFEADLIIVLVWLVLDIGVHVFLQFQLSGFQRNWPRTYALLVPIPIVRPSREEDAPGTWIRNWVFLAYAVLSFLLAVYFSFVMCTREPTGRFFGKMGYTHKPNGKLNTLFQDVWYRDES